MKLIDLFKACVNPHDTIMIWYESNNTLYDFDDFVMCCYQANVSFDTLANSIVTNICVNGDALQCEVDIDVKL